MLLGTILKSLTNEEQAAAALLDLGDIVLIGEVETARLCHDESLGEYVSGATRRFSRLAGDEEWLQLTTELERSPTPAATCLRSILQWSVSRDAAPDAGNGVCGCGGSKDGCHDQTGPT